MPVIIFNLLLTGAFALGIGILIISYQNQGKYQQTLQDLEWAVNSYIGKNCDGSLSGTVTHEDLGSTNDLPAGFDNQGTDFVLHLDGHPGIHWNARGAPGPEYLRFLALNRHGQIEPDDSYSFVPNADLTFYSASNPGYQLLAFDGRNFSCSPSTILPIPWNIIRGLLTY